MANASSGGLQRILDTCTHFNGGEVTITVDGPGMVVVSATLTFEIEHTVGNQDFLEAYIGQSDSDCTRDDHMLSQGVDAAEPTQTFISTVYLHKPFAVAGAGTYTYYLNAEMGVGAFTWDNFAMVSMIAVFYPS